MRLLLIALLLTGFSVTVAYSGTFLDDFDDGNLDGGVSSENGAASLSYGIGYRLGISIDQLSE